MKAIDLGDTVCTMIFGFPSGLKAIEAFVSQKPDKIWKTPGPGFNSFFNPIALAVNSKGNIYVLEWSRHRVLKLAPTGSLLEQWGIREQVKVNFYTQLRLQLIKMILSISLIKESSNTEI